MPRIALVCVPACLLAIATAQERRPQPGLLLDADGKPVAGAAVTLVFAPPFASALGGADIVRATTDQQGRFRAELLAGADYKGWAAAGDAASRLVEVVPGQQWELRLQQARPGRDRLLVGGAEDWRSAGQLQLRAWIGSASGVLPDAALDGDGIARMPGLPDDAVMLELLDGRGQTIDVLYSDGRKVQADVAPPQQLRALVVDDKGQPLAGATIARVLNIRNGRMEPLPSVNEGRLVPLAVTGEDGRATLRVADFKDPFEGAERSAGLVFVASKAGHAASLSCFAGKLYCDGKPASVEQLKARELRFELAPAAPVRGQLLAAKDQPVAQIVLSVGPGSFSNRWNVAVAVDAQGAFELPPLPPGTTVDTAYVPAVRPALADDDPFRRALAQRPLALRFDDRYAMLRGPNGEPPPRAARARPVLDLRYLQPLRLQVLDCQRGPARRAGVHLAPLPDEQELVNERTPSPGTTDGAGRLAMALPRGRWRLFVAGVDGFVQKEIEIGAEVPAPLELQLGPYEAMPLHVIDGDGNPVVGAEVQFAGFSSSGGSMALHEYALRITPWLLRRVSTDARGDCVVRFLSGQNMQFTVAVRDGDRRSVELVLAAEEQPLEVRLR